MIDTEQVWQALRRVIDPELDINIVDLGLIYEVVHENGDLCVVMTLTTPGCPLSQSLPRAVLQAVSLVPGVTQADVVITFDPPWTPARISADGRRQLCRAARST
jgi:metal-sulfur cluster biosynthetic enzyme